MERKPITEQSNPKSENIDVSSPEDIVNILANCDDELFEGFDSSQGLFQEDVLKSIESVATIVSDLLYTPNESCIILSGCGTSGRLAFMVCSTFNVKLKALNSKPCFKYLIAGGDEALFTSQEAFEDDPGTGKADLMKAIAGKRRIVYIGITCGLSAPYVGGQIEYSIQHKDTITPVLIGFNPTSRARDNRVEKWDKTFRDICMDLETEQSQGHAFIINPVIGPEPITGSSRMKGGSATKILLDSIFISAFLRLNMATSNILNTPSASQLIESYKIVKEATYKKSKELAKVVESAGNNFLHGGHIYYISDDRCGIVGLIDGSECPPTYGSSMDDVRGFLHDGYLQLGNKEGDISTFFDISKKHFVVDVVPTLTSHDTVIVLQECHLEDSIVNCPATKMKLHVSDSESLKPSDKSLDVYIAIPKANLVESLGETCIDFSWNLYVEIALKWACNVISTGSHIMKGKVYQNIMVDVKVSNNKLFHRAVGIVEKLGNCSKDVAVSCLLKSIYGVNELTGEITEAPLSRHIALANPQNGVVPLAIVMAKTGLAYHKARQEIKLKPVIRHMLAELVS